MQIPILFENDDMLVINKPAGISVHGDGRDPSLTIADWFVATYPASQGVGEPMLLNGIDVPRHGIVHRLDKETTGVLILAKTQEAYLHLKEQFQHHTIKKEYHAFVYGAPKTDTGTITESIGRSGGDIRKWTTGKTARGTLRPAETHYEVRARVDFRTGEPEFFEGGSTEDNMFALLALYPKTGRTHQLRVHLRYINTPIVSDSLYASNRPRALGFARLALHAWEIQFVLLNGEQMSVFAPYPTDFENALKTCKI